MRLRVTHRTEYAYDEPVPYALQRLRLVPQSGPTQQVVRWALGIEGAVEEVRFLDQFGNDTRLVSIAGAGHEIVVTAEGEVDTTETSGIFGQHRGFAPLWLFAAQTELTRAGDGVAGLAAGLAGGSDIDRLHALTTTVRDHIAFVPGATDTQTTAEAALARGKGVCQDHAHVFIAAARHLGFPARYVSGYLMLDGQAMQVASHAWAEAHVDGLGWVGFDAANGISPDTRYVRLATGRDYRDAMPVSGIILGKAAERLAVSITVEQ
ncbi:MAG: transglutaminase family protein [Rhizobiales bacterium]|nr:transglutaminase family protein [Hyphomicrobiales bacterium]OJU34314.1 MAG: transglutaminase [Rhizobiales bacterium 68-8]